MAEFQIDSMRFPVTVDQVITQGDDFEFEIDIVGIGLANPLVYDMNKKPNKITLIDVNNKIYSVRCKLGSLQEDRRTQTGNYTFRGKVNTKFLPKGNLRLLGETYNLRGEFVPIRQLHKIV